MRKNVFLLNCTKCRTKAAAFVRHFSILIHILSNAVPDKSTYEFAARLLSTISIISCIRKKNGSNLQLSAKHPGFQLKHNFSQFPFSLRQIFLILYC